MRERATEAKLNFLARRSDIFWKALVHKSLVFCLKQSRTLVKKHLYKQYVSWFCSQQYSIHLWQTAVYIHYYY